MDITLSHARTLTAAALAVAALAPFSARADDALTVAISPDIPPYVQDRAAGGLEVDLLRALLPDHTLNFVQRPYDALQAAVPTGDADVSIGVQAAADGIAYSRDVVSFVNFAISHRADALRIDSVADMVGHEVLTWQDAYRELGPEFERLFAPGAAHHGDYVEVADQTDQVARFWAAAGRVIVIDASIFERISAGLGHDPRATVYHRLFAPTTNFKVAFRDPELRDRFDAGLVELCASGAYQDLLDRHGMTAGSVCAATE